MKRIELFLTILMTLAAVSVAGALVRREFLPASEVPGNNRSSPTSPVDSAHWSQMLTLGRVISDSGGAKQMVIFSDYECPACKRFHSVVRELERDAPGLYEVRLVHMPLSYHRFAEPAARMAECASDQSLFVRLTDQLFALQDSLGLLSWVELAERIGAPDPAGLSQCASSGSDSLRFQRIYEGIQLAREIGATGTPTVVIEGIRYALPPQKAEIIRASESSAP